MRPYELALLSPISFCNIPVVSSILDLVFCFFDQIVDRQFRKERRNQKGEFSLV